MKRAHREAALKMGMPQPAAHDLGDQMDLWIKSLVGIIERTGGAEGGQA